MNLEEKKKGFKFPDTALLLFIIIFVMAALTYVIPAGEFERVVDEESGRTLVLAGTYAEVEGSPTTLTQAFSSVFRGLVKASEIIAFVFVVGGSFGLISKSGAISAGLGSLVTKLKGRETLLVAIIMTAFAVCGATFGMAEESLPFVVILVTVALKMGYDPIVGVSMVLIGIYCGYSAGPLNPFNTAVAQGIAELPTFSGVGLRVLLMVGALIIAIIFTLRHGKKYKAQGIDNAPLLAQFNATEERKMTGTDKIILLVLLLTIAVLMYGVSQFGWYLTELSALFLAMGLIVGFIYYKTDLESIAKGFIDGAGEMTTAALYIGLSRAVLVIMEDGAIMDTIVYWLSIPLSQLNSVFAAWGMYISQGFINFFIPSSSGQAVVVMPILAPLSDVIGVTRQTAVMAFQAGDGFWNMITPTHSVVMASLGLAKIPFGKWFKFALPLVAAWTVWVFIVLAIAVLTNYGPF